MRSIALALPIARVSRCVPPIPGMMPSLISGWPNLALSAAMIRSHCRASSQPPPSAKPATAAITGLRRVAARSQVAAKSPRNASVKVFSAISLMSAPAANALSEPVMTTQPTLSSASKASSACFSSPISALLRALSACGRLSRINPTLPRVSTMMFSWLMIMSRKVWSLPRGRRRPFRDRERRRSPRRDRFRSPAVPGRRKRSFLAHRTIKRRAAVLHDALDDAAAAGSRAFSAGAVIDAEVMLEHPERAVGELVIAQRRAAGADCLLEHCLDARDQPRCALGRRAVSVGEGRRPAFGRQPRSMQSLADIDVAEPGDHALVGQRRLQARFPARAGGRQHGGVEGVAERLGAEPREQRLRVQLPAGDKLHRAEAKIGRA